MNNFTLPLSDCQKCKSLSRNKYFQIPKLFSILLLISYFAVYSDFCFAQISRAQIISNASSFVTFSWTAKSCNLWNGTSCVGGGNIYKAPWVTSAGTYTSMPYCWGGWSSQSEFNTAMTNCKSAGQVCSTGGGGCSNGGFPSAPLSCAAGLDCSGLVTRAWVLPYKRGTSADATYGLANDIISTRIPLTQTQPGDILNIDGHVRLVETNYGNGNYRVIEASGTDWKTAYHTYTAAQLASYDPRCPNSSIVTGGCGSISKPANDDCSGAITLTPNTTCSKTTGDISGATQSYAASGCSSGLIQDVWYKFIATSNGTYTIKLAPSSSMDGVVEVRQGSCTGTVLGCKDSGGGNGGIENLDVSVTNGTTYYVRVYEYNSAGNTTPPASTTFDICVTGAASSDCSITSINPSSETHGPASFSTTPGSDDIIINAQSNCSFVVTESCSWLTVTPMSGTTNSVKQAFLNYTLQANTSTSSRSCTVNVNGSTFTITQNGCTYDLYPTTKSVSASGSTYNLDIDSYSPCSWSIQNSSSWVHLSQTTGTGDPTISVTVDANGSVESRTGTITIVPGNATHVITQQGIAASLSISPTNLTLGSASGSNGSISVSSNVSWTASDDASWLSVSPISGSNNGTITVTATSANTGSSSRNGTVTITGSGITRTVTVTQDIVTPAPTLTVTPSSLTLEPASGSNGQISVTSNVSWTASDDASWLSVSPTSGTNNGTITVTATSANTGSSSRNGTVTITGSGITRTVTVTQDIVTPTPTLTVAPSSLTLEPASGSNGQISVTSNVSWTTSDDAAWLSVSPASGSNDGTITVTATSENPLTTSRNGTVTISGSGITRTVSVTQSGVIPPATLTIDNTNGSAGNTISIPVSATKFSDVVGFQFTIVYDKSKLDYVNCSNWSAGTNVSDIAITSLANDGKITFIYNNTAINIVNGKFFDLNFTIKTSATGSASLSWSDSPTAREISNSQPNEIPCSYNNGVLTIVTGYNLSGQLLYENTAQTPLNNISISLLNSNGQSVGTSSTDASSGSFSFPGLSNGNYTLKPDVKVAWGGASAMDITSYKKHIGNISTLSQIQVKSGDVNGSNSLTSMDLTIIKQRIGAQISSFTSGDWVYDPIAANINGTNLVQNIKALCYGDANGSYTPSTLKSSSNIFLASNEKISLLNNGEFEIPFILSKSVDKLSSVTLSLNYPSELFDVKDIKMIANNEDLYYSVKGEKISVVYSTLNSLNLKEGDVLMTIRFSLKKDASQAITNYNQLEFSGSGEFGDYDDQVLDNVKLTYATFDYNTLIKDFRKDEIKVYPNPATNLLTVTNVNDTKISVIDILGRSLLSVHCQSNSIELDIRSLLPGTYTLKINKNDEIIYRKFTVVK